MGYEPYSGNGVHSVRVGPEQATGYGAVKNLSATHWTSIDGPKPTYRTDQLQLLPGERTVTLRVYVDHWFCEAYWQGGRVAMTVITPASEKAAIAAKAVNGDVH